MIIMQAEPGQPIWRFADELIARAWATNDVVLGEFNQHTLEARVGMTREDVLRQWDEAQRRSYFG